MSQRKTKDQIGLSTAVRQELAQMIVPLNAYIRATRSNLNVPADWVMVNDQQGNPAAFVPPQVPEGPTKVVKKKRKSKKKSADKG